MRQREEASDPRIGLVTLTRVDVAPDLSNAVLYYSVMGAEAIDAATVERVDDGLHSAAPFLRRRAARAGRGHPRRQSTVGRRGGLRRRRR